MTFTLTLDVDAEPTRVFEFIADFATTPQWYSAVQRVERVHGTGGAGTTYTVHRRLPSGPAANTVVVDSRTEGEEITFASVDGPTPFSYRYRVRPAPGGSRLELEGSISAAGLPGPARLLGALAEPLFERGMRSNLKTLKGILEQ